MLWERFDYKPLTGELLHKVKGGGPQTGKYVWKSLQVDGKTHRFSAHRAIWKWVHGTDPTMTIDHINHDTHDNRIWNLRDVSYSVQNKHQRRYQI